MKAYKAYKVFDENWKCFDFQYEIGKKYKYESEIEICESGFHACEKLVDCFNYKSFNPKNKVAEVIVSGKIIKGDDKLVCSEIEIVKEITWEEVLKLCNSGDWNSGNRNTGYRNSGNCNSGDCNSGNRNTGYRNSGNCNTGNRNSGDHNSGDWNSGNCNSGNWNKCNKEKGFFNTKNSETIRVFNKLCELRDWEETNKPDFICFYLNKWIDFDGMSEQEKTNNPNSEIVGGYLKTFEYKEAFKKSWGEATEEDRKKILNLPNFDWEVFTEISGIEKPEDWE